MYILLDTSVVDCAFSHNLKACLQEYSFNENDVYARSDVTVFP